MKFNKFLSPHSHIEKTPAKEEEEPVSPYMKAKREVARPKKPLSAYIARRLVIP
jgi:hypothetical protein